MRIFISSCAGRRFFRFDRRATCSICARWKWFVVCLKLMMCFYGELNFVFCLNCVLFGVWWILI